MREPLAPADERRLALNLAAMTRLHELSTGLAQVGGNFESLLSRVLEAAIELTGADKGYIQLIDPATGTLRLAVQRGLGARFVERLADSSLVGATRALLQQGRQSLIGDVLQARRLMGTKDLDLLLADDTRAIAMLPMATRTGIVLGVVCIQFARPHDLGADEYRFLDLAAGMAADFIARTEAEEKLRILLQTQTQTQTQTQLEEKVTERTADLDAANARLRAEIVESGRARRAHEEVQRELSSAQEAERRRISRELHDEVGQQIAALLLAINELAEHYRIPANAPGLLHVQSIAQTLATEIHDLAVELRPTSLDDLGLARAVAAYAELWSERAGVKVDFHASGFEQGRVATAVETAVYRIVQEALTNVKKHARARTVSVILELKPKELAAIVEDDGIGFDPGVQRSIERLGILGMTERATLLGGDLRVESSVGSGTTVMVRVPV